ncbi:hypothetical protein KW849_18240 [Pseudomonas sp. PDM26]|uniref:hypothetical protein n=1 Tax=Pseudomonas sp. PDM26 TaxID=2854766 RepID=UPI001C47E361|nr:hypothetical protein [Pseudomonas sp. PDM26]MBV7548227.1 hypothetical protein [Pseudomonas sp. PDM26]
MAVTAAMNMYTRKKMVGRQVAIAGKSDRRTAAPTGIGIPRDCVKNQNLGFYRASARGLTG